MSIPGGPSADGDAKSDKKSAAAPIAAASATAASLSTDAKDSKSSAGAFVPQFDTRQPIAACAAKLCGQSLYSDVTFIVGKAQETKIPAHRFILAARSPAFEALLYHPVRPLTKLTKSISVKDVEPDAFMCMLRAIYSDKPGLTHDTVAGAAYCAKKYQVECLRAACVTFSKKGITAATACALYERSPELALAYIEANMSKVMQTPAFRALSERALSALLRSNKLDVSEPKLFKAVLKWAEAECERRKLDGSKPEVLREVLKNVILLIRFPLFTTEQISLHVTKANLLTPEQLLGVFSYLGGNKSAKCVFSAVPRESALATWTFDADRKAQTINLSNQNGVATVAGRGGWVLGNRLMKKGTHTWRVTFPALAGGQYVTFGVSGQKSYFDQRSSYTDNTVYAIDSIQQWYSAGVAQGTHYLTIQSVHSVDVQLNCDAGTLVFLNISTQQRHQINGLNKPNEGFVPHFHLNRNGCAIRVAAIKPTQFGKAGAGGGGGGGGGGFFGFGGGGGGGGGGGFFGGGGDDE